MQKGRLKFQSTLEALHPGLHLAGAIRDGIGMSDRVRQATLLAHELDGLLPTYDK